MKPANPPAIVRSAVDLKALAAEINAATKAGDDCKRKGAEHYRHSGKQLLLAKAEVGHGNWTAWMKDNIKFSAEQARRYMRLAKTVVTTDLEQQWQVINGNRDNDPEEEETRWEPTETPAPVPVQNGYHDKLIPELRCRVQDFTPRLIPRIEAMDEAMQHALNAKLIEGMHVLAAITRTEEDFAGIPSREAGDDTGNVRPRQTGPKNGSPIPVFNRSAFNEHLGRAEHELGNLARQYGMTRDSHRSSEGDIIIPSPQYLGITRKIKECEKEAEQWQKELSKNARNKETV
jgi:hypothetical protein